jgi:hypothetical protein
VLLPFKAVGSGKSLQDRKPEAKIVVAAFCLSKAGHLALPKRTNCEFLEVPVRWKAVNCVAASHNILIGRQALLFGTTNSASWTFLVFLCWYI